MAEEKPLADRLRALLETEPDFTEKAMFGGIGFMLRGSMCCGAMKGGDLMIRVGPGDDADLLANPYVRVMDTNGRPMKGWLLVSPPGFATKRDLTALVKRAIRHVRTLPPKTPKRRKPS